MGQFYGLNRRASLKDVFLSERHYPVGRFLLCPVCRFLAFAGRTLLAYRQFINLAGWLCPPIRPHFFNIYDRTRGSAVALHADVFILLTNGWLRPPPVLV